MVASSIELYFDLYHLDHNNPVDYMYIERHGPFETETEAKIVLKYRRFLYAIFGEFSRAHLFSGVYQVGENVVIETNQWYFNVKYEGTTRLFGPFKDIKIARSARYRSKEFYFYEKNAKVGFCYQMMNIKKVAGRA